MLKLMLKLFVVEKEDDLYGNFEVDDKIKCKGKLKGCRKCC